MAKKDGCLPGEMHVNGHCVPDMEKPFCVLGFNKFLLKEWLESQEKMGYAEDIKRLDSYDMEAIASSVGRAAGLENICDAEVFTDSALDIIEWKKKNR